ncbi:NfeD family protein [Methylotenera versatilis]|uniref:NfeD family protein n=1 Tax=Methylotenera versatilis TaxID=1055487 RepID=UPI00064878F8|nr:NfeD family protein [Methylotenera versatilis]
MIDAMWIWGAIGLLLLAVEISTGTVYVLWFGISALCVALATWIFPNMPPAVQFAVFAALSIGSLAIWKLNYKKTETHSRVGQAQGEEIGRTGTVIESVNPNQNGKISFVQGLMGSREWVAVSNESIEVGSQAKVVAVEGNALRIIKI